MKGIKLFSTFLLVGVFAAVAATSVIEQRQSEFNDIKDNMKAVSAAVKSNDRKTVAKEATDMAGHFSALRVMFPKGSHKGATDSNSNVWKKFNDFEDGLIYAEQMALELATAANSKGEMTAALDEVGKTCKSCHGEFRKPKEKSYKNK